MAPRFIGIAGPSCSGKTRLARAVAGRLDAPVLALDSYYRQLSHLPLAARARVNFDEPAALDHALIADHLRRLSQGLPVRKPVYDFASHTRLAETELVAPRAFLVVEGLFALYWEDLRRFYDVAVFVRLDGRECFRRRLERDVRERGRTPESVREQYEATVRPMAERYILPTAAFAGLVLDGAQPLEESVAAVLAQLENPPLPDR